MVDFDLQVNDLAVRESLNDIIDDWSDAGTFIVGTGVEYAIHIEFGRGPVEATNAEALQFEDENGDVIYRTSVSGHPPYPFFRPAIRELRANPEQFILENTELNTLDALTTADEVVQTIAFALEAQIKRNATANSSNRSPGVDPNHPQVQTGNLRASISAQRIQ